MCSFKFFHGNVGEQKLMADQSSDTEIIFKQDQEIKNIS